MIFFILVFYGLLITQKINLATADLGRHIQNGRFFPQNLKTNFYSYSFPNFSVINHHYGSGLIFYWLWKNFDFFGLHLFFIILSLSVFFIFFNLAKQESGPTITTTFSLLLIPLIAERRELRPEIFSYFFLTLFFLILWKYKKKEISYHLLFLLPFFEILWVNLHIYFIFGLFLIGALSVEYLIKNQKKDFFKIFLMGFFISLATFLNPFTVKGAVEPFFIFRNYNYRIVENMSVFFLQKWGFQEPNLVLFEIVFIILVISFILVFIKNRSRFSLFLFLISFGFGVMALLAMRNFTVFGLFSLFSLSYNTNAFLEKIKLKNRKMLISFLAVCFLTFNLITNKEKINSSVSQFGLGLPEGINLSAEFFKSEKISGPIFNNYDLGGYLIFHLYPQEKVFVDNRPEAYPASFFNQIYLPIQENKKEWEKAVNRYKFNVIFFYRHDLTPWAQKFLIDRIDDPLWAPVYVDNWVIIFLKRTVNNQKIIQKYELPRKMFIIQS